MPALWRMRRDYAMPYYVGCRIIAAECHAVLGQADTAGYIFDHLLMDPAMPRQLRSRIEIERTRVASIGR